ncbi:hypothetical protein HOK68_05200 [Candidatus Woesearchaeota archaeon]|jgi:DNA-directed RNA polymerase subunit L|nr:hypothetical protein [Candidatus Woesearchaeota archaeon]MBT4387219.1 hypothetical protein [Candidatus Woesearchaeota archaeon]MBT4596221.1 hypothetical protein [Candidatus Woesearchaeota archaeon]MBT5741556.1 hypothetical protein [Candidatus Woesearchaeota archaeon]MBT6506146.1 hypothetical protein [Candidatus Woesearchaeota archaeon]
MDIFKVLTEDNNSIEFELPKFDHGFSKLLVDMLWKEKNVIAAAYNKSHPLVGIVKVFLQTNGKVKPRDVLQTVLKLIIDKNLNLKKQISKL